MSGLRYVYGCGKPSGVDVNPGACTERQTDLHDARNFSILSLEHHNVECGANEALNSFKLKSIDYSLFQYIYTCCKLR